MTATSFILNLSKRTPLFSAEVWNSFVFLILKRFQMSVMQKLSRCVWVLIRWFFFFCFAAVNGNKRNFSFSNK